jgi:hypothetical protein
MVRAVHIALSCVDIILDEVQSPDHSENNINNINALEFYHLIRWNVVCHASTLAETLRISSRLRRSSRIKRGA